MPTVDELGTVPSGGLLHDALTAGIADISQQTTVSFTIYQKVVLPLDGFVFWLRSAVFDQTGAIHFMIERDQDETETRARNTIVFTTTEQVQEFNDTNTQQLVVGEIADRRYAFSRHGWFFPQAGVWHYQGTGLPSSTDTQLVDDPSQINTTTPIVSNSLPAWLTLVSYDPVWVSWPVERNPHVTLYPSFLVPDNLDPPYGVVHIEPSRIEALQDTAMWTTPTFDHYQLTRESVRVTLYGCNNNQAADFLDLVEQYSLDTDSFGILNMPTIRDGKKPWPEGMVIAQQKFVDFEVSYIQTRINDVARQLITSAFATILPDDLARTAGFGGPQAQAGIQAGLLPLLVAMGGRFDGSGSASASPRAIGTGIFAEVDGAAGLAALANVRPRSAAKVDGAGAMVGALGVLPGRVSAQSNAAAGISASCSVLMGIAGQIDGIAGPVL